MHEHTFHAMRLGKSRWVKHAMTLLEAQGWVRCSVCSTEHSHIFHKESCQREPKMEATP